MGTPGALALIDDNVVLDRIRGGEHASQVAASLNVHKSALSHRYKGKDEYIEARETGTEVRLNDIEAEIAKLSIPLPQPILDDMPTDAQLLRYKVELKAWQMSHSEREFNLACARERYRAVSWRAEREFPHRWGQKTNQINMQVNGSGEVKADSSGIQITFVAAQPVQCNTIDGSVVDGKDTK